MENQISIKNENILKLILIIIGIGMIASIFLMILFLKKEINQLEKESFLLIEKNKEEKTKEPPEIILPKAIYNFSGTIEELGKGYIIFEAIIPQLDERNNLTYRKELKKALINDNTKFFQLNFILTEENLKIPQEVPINFKDLKLKDKIEVFSNQDISQSFEFVATQVKLQAH